MRCRGWCCGWKKATAAGKQRDLAEEKIVYLYLDAIYPKVRSGGRVVSLPVLVALGVRENGEKVLLSLITTGAESADGWQLLLDDLAARKMGRPRLVISDGNAGLAAALDRRWPGLPHQRCTVHKLRNLLAKAPKHTHEAVREEYHRMVLRRDPCGRRENAGRVFAEVEENMFQKFEAIPTALSLHELLRASRLSGGHE